MFDFINIILLLVIFLYFLFAYFLYSKGKDRAVIYSYLFVIFSAIAWTFAMFIYRSVSPGNSLFWCRILYVVAILPSSSFYFFASIFPFGKIPSKKNILFVVLLGVLTAFFVIIPNAIIREVKVLVGQEKIIIWGYWYFLYFLYISGVITLGLFILLKKYFNEKGVIKVQIKYIFWGYFLGSGMAMFPNLLLPWIGTFSINWLGQVLGVLTVALTVYAIIKHRLMDIKFALRRISVSIASIVTIIAFAFLIKYFFESYLYDIAYWADFLILIFGIIIYPSLRKYFYRIANKYFFSSLYDGQEVIAELSDKLRTTLNIETIYDYIYKSLDGAFHLRAFSILSHDERKGAYVVKYNQGFNPGRRSNFLGNPILKDLFISRNKSIIIEDLKLEDFDKRGKELIDTLKKLEVEIITPLNIKDKTVGLLALGPKESNDIYNSEDLRVLETIGAQSAIAIENAELYEDTKAFNVKLKQEIKKATKELREANEKLKRLDKTKSEFISIASHQLRTPLTVVKGYIAMILDGDFGESNALITESLGKVFESNERLIQLVENLLNVSRIESGRLKFSFEIMQLEDLIESVAEELKSAAKKKKLKFKFEKPRKSLPRVKIDQEKIRQVVMNLVDNSIKYTKKGSVTVSVKNTDKEIEFCVRDSGMGVSPADMPNLFNKFSRGEDSSLVHTEGTGLGLYVAKNMIELHKGKIWAESKGVGKGSAFCFKIPVYDPLAK